MQEPREPRDEIGCFRRIASCLPGGAACRRGQAVRQPVAAVPEITELSIGFAIVARAAIVGIEKAVEDMLILLER